MDTVAHNSILKRNIMKIVIFTLFLHIISKLKYVVNSTHLLYVITYLKKLHLEPL